RPSSADSGWRATCHCAASVHRQYRQGDVRWRWRCVCCVRIRLGSWFQGHQEGESDEQCTDDRERRGEGEGCRGRFM
ncbi:hypothetical protein LTR91_019156, partial [Friedmanniomyces endolithicus]